MILVISPHADDETLGCGGTLFKFKDKCWLTFTCKDDELMDSVAEKYKFNDYAALKYETCRLDEVPRKEMVKNVWDYVQRMKPKTILAPCPKDYHSDHRMVYEVVRSATKAFKAPFVENILVYETISQTVGFSPNLYVDITDTIDAKLDVMGMYGDEMFFPRDCASVEALARYRGSQCYVKYAEGFIVERMFWR